MGVSISKVRSATLDKIDNYLLAFLKAVGNTNANNIFVRLRWWRAASSC